MIFQIKSRYDDEGSNNLGFFDNKEKALKALNNVRPNNDYTEDSYKYTLKLVSYELGLNKKPTVIKKIKFKTTFDSFYNEKKWQRE